MIWIITSPERIHEEAAIITALLLAGTERILLRKPGWSAAQYAALLDALPPVYYDRLLIRDQPALAATYGLAGVHWSGEYRQQCQERPVQYTNNGALVSHPMKQPMQLPSPENFKDNSTGIHTTSEITVTDKRIHTLLLSPVFNSISKPGYQGRFGERLGNKHSPRVLALGGVDHHNIHLVKQWHFDGAALLGAIWKTPANAVDNYHRIQELWNKSDLQS